MFFDPDADIDIKDGGNLPHWHQDGKIQFVTFRLADSLPANVTHELKSKVEEFRKLHPQPWSDNVLRKYWNIIGPMEERLLDKGYGSGVLKIKEIRDIVKNAILYQDGIDYNIIAFVIMPNHVHLLIQLFEDKTLSKILHSVKRFTAYSINKLLNQQGQLWLNESFDRIVRSQKHLDHCIRYIKENPQHLSSDQFELYIK